VIVCEKQIQLHYLLFY